MRRREASIKKEREQEGESKVESVYGRERR